MKENLGKKYASHTRVKILTDSIKDEIAVLYFCHGWTNFRIRQHLKEKDIEIAETTLRATITEQRKQRDEIKREVLKEQYSELFRGEKERLHFNVEYYASEAFKIWNELDEKERNSWKSWSKLKDLENKCRDQMVQLELASIDPEKFEDMEDDLKNIKLKLKLDDEPSKSDIK